MAIMHRPQALLPATFALLLATGSAFAQDSFLDVGKQEPITILINASPWYNGFEKVVDLYTEQTGNEVKLEVTPFNGMLEKARSAVRSGGTSPLDLININSISTVEFYEGGFLQPLNEIDPDFKLDPQVLGLNDAGCWDEAKKFRICASGKLMGYAPNGNVQLFYYRKDVYEEKGMKVPTTFDDVLANCKALHSPPATYGYLQRGERGDSIYYDFMAYMLAYGGSVEKDAANGDYTVTVNSPQVKQALDKFIEIGKACGPENYATLGQGDLIQLMQTGKGMQSHAVVAAFPNFDNPQKSAVVGQINAAPLPRATAEGEPGVAIGSWVFGIPKNASDAGKKGAIAFSKWFLTYKAQYAYAEGGGIPVRTDVFESDLKDQEQFRWMPAYLEEIKYGKQLLGYNEGPAINQIMGLRLNQALIGEMTSAAALNKIAQEVHDLFAKNGRKTAMLEPLAE
ncbi:extracellular solute-binding protein [Rhizobium sp. SSA_523]|uniref:extracellular solute-binding protein n=1 Tax=Rhizobium sp. SSA_523 TaxID=2952477 RepID=UPI00209123A5|nr:extracellular solute-binding protein [Rhizobium sp. SSA_523]MCO5734168.1 extracellular solute-binding protein [Rhizobium sp. SSA_523]WKC21551.1 extracellular solute-binding protein [Rhizobium sp. SSA_523]